jgi:hypothetical protein
LPESVILKGLPDLEWTPFPKNNDGSPIKYLSQDHIYLRIHQTIEIDFTDFWSNYDAEITYWLHLHLNGGNVTGHVAKWSYWIEGGAFTSVIKQILEPNVKLSVFSLNDAINEALSELPPNITGLYYLPGRQLKPVKSGTWDFRLDDTSDDVTIIFEL